jgi:uncharacterized coiled-coil protein SlyX
MPAKSKQQQKFMGIVHAIQKGEMKPSDASKKAQAVAKEMKPKDVTKFAATKHKGLPKKVKENMDGAVDSVYAVQKPYSGCQLTSLVHPIDPLKGLEGSQIVPDQIHGVYPDQETADQVAGGLYEEYTQGVKALEEKKHKVMEKIKKTMNMLEKTRKMHVDMIKENPKDSTEHREKVAKIASQLDDLVDKLQKIERSKKEVEGEENKDSKKKKSEEDKKKLHEELKKFVYKKIQGGEEAEVEAENEKQAKAKAVKHGGDVKSVKEKEAPEAEKTEDKPEDKK